LGFQFGIGPGGAGGHDEEIDGVSGLAQALQTVGATGFDVVADIKAGAVRHRAEEEQLVVFV